MLVRYFQKKVLFAVTASCTRHDEPSLSVHSLHCLQGCLLDGACLLHSVSHPHKVTHLGFLEDRLFDGKASRARFLGLCAHAHNGSWSLLGGCDEAYRDRGLSRDRDHGHLCDEAKGECQQRCLYGNSFLDRQ